MHSRSFGHSLALLPVLFSIAGVITFGILQTSTEAIEPPYLLPTLNTIFLFLPACVVAYVAMRSYLASGSATILWLGSGVLAFGAGSFAGGWTIVRWGANVTTTLHNSAMLLAAIFHITGVIISSRDQSREPDPAQRRRKLFTAYVGALIFVFSLFLLSIKGITPPFFVSGIGPTILRQAVLAAAFVLLVYSSAFMMTRFLWKKEPYLYWYSLALTLLVIGIAGIYVQSAVGSHVGWVGRCAQYLAGIYFIASVLSAKRDAQIEGVSLNEAIAELFLTPGFHWQEILKTALNGFWIADTKGRFLEVNEACCRILGYTRRELLSMTIGDVEAVEPPSRVLHHIEALKEKQTDHFISKHRRKDGTVIDVEVNGTYLDIGTGEIATFFQDITERKRAEEAVIATLESIQDGFFAVDGEWRFIYVNAVAERVLGISRSEVLGKSYWEVFPLALGTGLESEYRRAAAGEVRDFENHYEPWNRWFHNTCYPRKGGGMTVYFREITERKRAEEALRESDERLRFALDTSHIGAWDLDLVDHSAFRSLEHDRIFGYEDLLSSWTYEMFLEHVLPEDRMMVDREFQHAIVTQSDWKFECRIRRTDGEVRWIFAAGRHRSNASGNIKRFAGIVQDITERKQTEEKLRRSERLYRAIGESINYGIWVCEPDGRNVYASESFLNLVGITQEQCSNFGWGDVLHPDDAERTIAAWKECVRTGGVWDIEHRFRGVDGQWHPILARGVAVRNEQGEIICWAGINLDIGSLKKVEKSLQERTQELEDANRELESFSYTISHDLRAPLRAIDGYSRMILRKHVDTFDEDSSMKFNVIRENTRMMGQLIEDLLAFSRLGRTALSTTTLDIGGLMTEVWEDLKALNSDRRLTLKMGEIPPCRGDRTLIKQVLVNILSNAVKFTKGREEALIEAGGESKEGKNVYYIRDNGVGFDMHYHDKLFGVFQRLHSAADYEGTGVGLAIVQRIILRHGGRVWAESEVDKGATFYFTIPAGNIGSTL
jgi:PAS domain S-box-containing protein